MLTRRRVSPCSCETCCVLGCKGRKLSAEKPQEIPKQGGFGMNFPPSNKHEVDKGPVLQRKIVF